MDRMLVREQKEVRDAAAQPVDQTKVPGISVVVGIDPYRRHDQIVVRQEAVVSPTVGRYQHILARELELAGGILRLAQNEDAIEGRVCKNCPMMIALHHDYFR